MDSRKKPKMDKICDICGTVGFPESIMTCSRCKKASEHIYCMRNELNVAHDTWFCEACQVVESNCFQVKEIERNSPSSIQHANVGEMQIPGRSKPFCAEDKMQEMLDVSKAMPVSAAFSPSSEHALRALSCNSNYKTPEVSKVKFLPISEVTKLNSGVKVGASTVKCISSGSLHRSDRSSPSSVSSPPSNRVLPQSCQPNVTSSLSGSSHRSCKATIMPSPNSRGSPSIPNTSTKAIKESSDVKIYSSPKHPLVVDHARNEKEKKILQHRIIGEDAFTALGKEGSFEGSTVTKVDISSKSKMSMRSKCSFDSSSMHDNDGQCQKSVDFSLALPKEEPWESGFVDPSVKKSPPMFIKPENAHIEKLAFQDRDLPLILLVDPNVILPNRHTRNACWNGTFEVLDVVTHAYHGVQAYFPLEVSSKCYEIQKQMPEKLKLKVLPRTDAWPRAFLSDPPTSEDIALYFFPCEDERPREKYFRLMERIDLHDSVMQTSVGEVKLIIFTSKQLPLDCQRMGAHFYFWGIFRHVKHKNSGQRIEESIPSSRASCTLRKASNQPTIPLEGISGEVNMEIDMIGGSEIGRIDMPIQRLDAPPGFPVPISGHVNHEKKFEFKSVPCPNISCSPPGFSQAPQVKHRGGSSILEHKSPIPSRKGATGACSLSTEGVNASAASQACEVQSKSCRVQNQLHKHVR